MARKIQNRKAPARNRAYQSQDLLLAGIGAVSLGRKQIISAYANGFDNVVDLADRTQEAVQAAASSISGQAADYAKKVVALRKQVDKRIVVLRTQVDSKVEGLRKQAKATLAPMLAQLGVKKAPVRRKATRAKPAAKRVRKAA